MHVVDVIASSLIVVDVVAEDVDVTTFAFFSSLFNNLQVIEKNGLSFQHP